jgi:hypothetical protein
MALGYEGLIKLGTHYVLGTGSSVPSTRVRLESSSGFGGKINGAPETGISAPFNYDWSQVDGSISFELTKDVFVDEIKDWIFDRQSVKPILLQSRKDNVQQFNSCFFNSISISTSDGSVVDSSVGFVALKQDTYTWGSNYIGNRKGKACPLDPPPLNPSLGNINPIPFWNTTITVAGTKKNFMNWSLDFSQEIVKFFACKNNATVQEPLYVAAGPLMVTFSGSYMEDFPGTNAYLADYLTDIVIGIDSDSITLKRLENNSKSDDVQTAETPVPLTVEYSAYEIQS